jgi:broad specificity phosphatase PhoE
VPLKARLTLICHGATASNRAATFPGDERLEEKAAEQTEMLGRHVTGADHVWISPAQRAAQTAEILGLRGDVEPSLRDCDYGRWTGSSLAAIHAEDPDGLARWMSAFDAAPHGGEPLAGLCVRVAGWLDGRLGDSGHTVAITHASVIRACLLHVLQAPQPAFWKIDVEPLSVTELSGDGRRWALRLANDL